MRQKSVERMTNVEFVTEMMEYSQAGPLVQPFVIEALRQYAQTVVSQPASAYETSYLSGEAWHACGRDILRRINEKYGVAK